jgi:mannose-1-phosphate guanylyltransferase
MIDALPHVVILAGGEGNRLAPLTRALHSRELPKQFAVIDGDHSLLQTTVEHATTLTALARISVVATARHEQYARDQLAGFPEIDLVVQPRNLDTAPGMLLALARILSHASNPRVVFLPSDHHVSNIEPIRRALADAEHGELAQWISLIGVPPPGPELDHRWIVPGASLATSTAFAVNQLLDSPSPSEAEQLWLDGALWNTGIVAGPARAFWHFARQLLHDHAAALEGYSLAIGQTSENAALEDAYHAMPAASFNRDVLAHADQLAVLRVAGSGWSDWESPARVFASLEGTAGAARLISRIRGDRAA